MNRRLLFLIPFILLTSCNNHVDYTSFEYEESSVAKYTFSKLDSDTMPISAWCGPDSSLGLNTLEQFKNVKDAGLNMIYGGMGDWIWENDSELSRKRKGIYKSFEYAEQNDLLFLPIDQGAHNLNKEDTIAYLKEAHYEDYESFAGILEWDEPRYADYKTIKTLRENFYSYYDSSYLFYVNLNPCYLPEYYLAGRDYQQYLEDFVSITNSPYFSYDFYPEYGDTPNMRSDYFLNLVYASRVSRRFNVPFWNFVLASSHKAGTGQYRLPTEGEIYWQVSTSLAYGCKGFQYFCFMTPNGDDYLGMPGSIVNERGERSTIYPFIQNVNKAISYFDDILINSTLIGFMSDGNTKLTVFSPFPNESNNNRDIKSFKCKNGGILSTFSYGKKTVYLLTNNNFEKSSTLNVNFSRGIIGNILSFDNTTKPFKGNKLSLTLKAGECVLLEVTN